MEEDVEEEVEEEVVTVGEEVEMGVVLGAEVADGDVVELLALVVMLLILSVSVCVWYNLWLILYFTAIMRKVGVGGGGSWANEIVTYTFNHATSCTQIWSCDYIYMYI